MANKVKVEEHDYYGTIREWCVGRVSMEDYIGKDDRENNKILVELDFGKPYRDDFKYKREYLGGTRYDMDRIIENETKAVMEGGSRNDIVDEVLKAIDDKYECEITYRSYEKSNTWMNHLRLDVVKKGEGRMGNYEIAVADDIKPYLAEEDKNASGDAPNFYYGTNKNSYYGKKAVAYLINREIKNKYTYCVKNGKNIVPDEYLKDGSAGIERWKSEKSKNNKQNSIEKQMMKKLKYEKKHQAFNDFNSVIAAMCNEKSVHDWGTVFLAVEGRYNTGRRLKTIQKHILKDMADDELIKMEDEEIKKRCKSYWVKELMDAIERIKNL